MRIWIYGCSFSSGYEELYFDKRTWPYLLANNTHEIVHRGKGGGSFYDVREYLLQDIGKIKEDDLLIIQLPTSNRVVIPYFVEEWNSFMGIRDKHPKGAIEWIRYMKDFDGLRDALANEVITVFDLLNRLNLNWVWWTAEKASKNLYDKYPDNNLKIEQYDNYEQWIFDNRQYWNEQPDDWHQNIEGHKAMARTFKEQLNEWGRFSFSSTKSSRAISPNRPTYPYGH